MVGYDEKAKNAYRVWIPSKKMILTRRDVIFDESREWDNPDKEKESDLLRRYPDLLQDQLDHPFSINEKETFFNEGEQQYDDIDSDYGEIETDEQGIEEKEQDININNNRINSTKIELIINNTIIIRPTIPTTVNEALDGSDKDKWIEAILTELNQLDDKGTFEYVNYQKYKNIAAKSKFIFDVKYDADMSLRWKARLVLCGYSQIKGLNYEQTFAATLKKSSILLAQHIMLIKRFKNKICDVGGAFAESKNDFEDIFMILPKRIFSDTIVRVKNSLYGEKQAAYLWYKSLSEILINLNCNCLISDQCIFIRKDNRGEIDMIILIFVDDILIGSRTMGDLNQFIQDFKPYVQKVREYEEYQKFLGINMKYNNQLSTRLFMSISMTLFSPNILTTSYFCLFPKIKCFSN
jgi:hypothetical protein